MDFTFGFGKKTTKEETKKQTSDLKQQETKSSWSWPWGGMGAGFHGGSVPPIIDRPFSGEKTPGELGAVVRNIPLYEHLRFRSYAAYATTDLIKILASKRFQWVVGAGLDIEIEPNKDYLEMRGITVPENFKDRVEAIWTTYIDTIYIDYKRKSNLHKLAMDFYQDEFLGGDCLCVCRVEDEGLSVQFISGEHVKSPLIDEVLNLKPETHTIQHGIEYNERGQEVAYYVYRMGVDGIGTYDRVSAYGETSKRQMAWMIYGQKLSSDHARGIPEATQVLEKSVKLDRYTEATVTKAEQNANIIYTIEHSENSTGENIFEAQFKRKAALLSSVEGEEAKEVPDNWALADGHAQRISQATSGTAINLVPGSKLESVVNESEINYADFYTPNFDMVSASLGTPPEVALNKYNSNYSASRAAINAWGYTVGLERKAFAKQFYEKVYELWLELTISRGQIDAPGFIQAIDRKDFMIIKAYSKCRFVGVNMPHIDPLKEVKAIREMLGDPRNGIDSLTSLEQACEMLGLGDWWANYEKYLKEQKEITKNTPKDSSINQQDDII